MLYLLLASFLTFVELNCENLFDCRHDSLKDDLQFLPEGSYNWTPFRYWKKINHTAQTILSCSGSNSDPILPDIVALVEVENDTVMHDLTRRSLLRNAKYEYIITSSPDVRGIDVALLYQPLSFRPVSHTSIRVPMPEGVRPTRDILYVQGITINGTMLHIFVVHAPSRASGEAVTQKYRNLVAGKVVEKIDSIVSDDAEAQMIVTGDFNDYASGSSLVCYQSRGLVNVSTEAKGRAVAKGTYRYQGDWGSLDHFIVSRNISSDVCCYINDVAFLLEEDEKYGGYKPRRNYLGPQWRNGYSDHLPLVMKWNIQ